ncbi:hypothetical protein FSHL1_007071 [Fusarium sambucinum]
MLISNPDYPNGSADITTQPAQHSNNANLSTELTKDSENENENLGKLSTGKATQICPDIRALGMTKRVVGVSGRTCLRPQKIPDLPRGHQWDGVRPIEEIRHIYDFKFDADPSVLNNILLQIDRMPRYACSYNSTVRLTVIREHLPYSLASHCLASPVSPEVCHSNAMFLIRSRCRPHHANPKWKLEFASTNNIKTDDRYTEPHTRSNSSTCLHPANRSKSEPRTTRLKKS